MCCDSWDFEESETEQDKKQRVQLGDDFLVKKMRHLYKYLRHSTI